jgi:hypothetical protein
MMKVHLTLAFALLLVCTGAALAQTPDGEPPSSETICDSETGAAYGLCNAYCEAMDCESDTPSASETACSKVRSKFQNITGRDLPCEQVAVTCPCTSIPQFAADLAGLTYCLIGPGFTRFAQNLNFGASDIYSIGCGISGFLLPSIFLPATEAEAASCNQLVVDAAASLGVTCETF